MLSSVVFLGAVALIVAHVSGRQGPVHVSGHGRLADGDSLQFGDRRVRLIGIDAPELHQNCRRGEAVVDCGRQARKHLVALVNSREIACEGDRYDRYDRLLARCRAAGVDLNAAMVRDGWALAYGGYEAEEAEARRAGRGLWALDFEAPVLWRRTHEGDDARRASDTGSGLSGLVGQALTKLVDWLKSLVD